MKGCQFFVCYTPENNCFLYLSESWIKRIQERSSLGCALRMECGSKCCGYFSWSPQAHSSIEENMVGINATYARTLGLSEGEVVSLSTHPKVISVSRINVSPLTAEDWEILELSSDTVQSSMLNQVRLVCQQQLLVTWVSKSMQILLRVDAVEPECEVGRLEVFTEVIVAPPTADKDTDFTEAYKFPSMFPDHEDVLNTTSQASDTTQPSPGNMWQAFKGHIQNFLFASKNDNKQGLHSSHKATDIKSLALLKKLTEESITVSVYRVHPLNFRGILLESKKGDYVLLDPYCILIQRNQLPNAYQSLSSDSTNGLICKLTKVANPAEKMTSNKFPFISSELSKQSDSSDVGVIHSNFTYTSVCVRFYIIEDYYSDMSDCAKEHVDRVTLSGVPQHRSILVPDAVRMLLNLKIGSRVTWEVLPLENISATNRACIALTGKGDSKKIEILFRLRMAQEVEKHGVAIVNTASVLKVGTLPDIVPISVTLEPKETEYVILNSEGLRRCKIYVKSSSDSITLPAVPDDRVSDQLKDMYLDHLEKPIREAITTMEINLGLLPVVAELQPNGGSLSTNNILIIGPEGSGKSTLQQAICNQLRKPPHFVHCVTLECKYLKGKTIETIQKKLSSLLAECVYRQPSVIILDDLDVIAGMPGTSSSQEGEEDYFLRVGEKLCELLKLCQTSNAVSVIATAVAVSSLNSALVAPRGRHIFKTFIKIPEIIKADRLEIVKMIFAIRTSTSKEVSSLNWDHHVTKMDGYVAQDLVDLVDKAIFVACKGKTSFDSAEDLVTDVRDADVEEVLKNFIPLSQRGVELYHNDTHSWKDVGGLSAVKEVLIEMLEWPSKYPELFKNSPLRHQSGLLLYGAPGTGKTLLASVVAKECGLKFISIKGPELLSKYIGASEEGVRNIFQKAESAKPCILFFDEFDSLAPRRGHDNTGVTDRVVNQLLTQLDGVESLDGVWVLAATSRPDLLDPALLRPGRLDRAIQCPLPKKEERLSILQALSHKINLSEDIEFDKIANATEDFTGADLQAILYTAQLAALEQTTSQSLGVDKKNSLKLREDSVGDSNVGKRLTVSMSHLLKALQETRPSVSKTELLKYQRIYEKFARSGNTTSAEEMSSLPQKATMA